MQRPDREMRTFAEVPDLALFENFISEDEERAWIETVENTGLTFPSYDRQKHRATNSFGWKHDFAIDQFVPCVPMPAQIREMRDRVAGTIGLEADSIAQCLIVRYEPGAQVAPHFDYPIWDMVIGVSLGASTIMHFRKDIQHSRLICVELKPRSIYVLSGAARYVYMHGLPRQTRHRWSLTFRTLADETAQCRNKPSP